MMMTHQEDYTVRLGAFHGPLDLLLYLIRRAEVDITDIPIAEITDQYMAFLRTIERIDIELAGDFLVVAATLMEIKSRMLMPPEEAEDGAESSGDATADALTADGLDRSDPRYDLVRQLLAYKRFRDAAAHLEERHEQWLNRFPVTGKKPLPSPIRFGPDGQATFVASDEEPREAA
ncbi:MAG: segregation and condensation protein A, partial [Planctomycetota bacterium]